MHILRTRRSAGKSRANKVKHLSTIVRASRRLYKSGVYPQSHWGHQAVGLDPKWIKQSRKTAAACTGIHQKGRCASTAILISYGRRSDPWQIAIKELFVEWFHIISVYYDASTDLKLHIAWGQAKSRIIKDDTVIWDNIIGIATNVIATLQSLGWQPLSFNAWIDPQLNSWTFVKGKFHAAHVIRALQDTVHLRIWQQASKHLYGTGLEFGVSWAHTTMLNRQLAKEKEYAKLAALETIQCAGCWDPARIQQQCKNADSVYCDCGLVDPTLFHQYWTCPKLLLDEAHPDILATNKYIATATLEHLALPCLWLRGMLPIIRNASIDNFVSAAPVTYLGQHPQGHPWPGGLYGLDAGGGEFSSIPELRRCGIGIAVLEYEYPHNFVWGVHSPLPGEIHTAVRAELYAIVFVCQQLIDICTATFVSDSKVNIDLFYSGKERCLSSSNGDLWELAFKAIELKELNIRIRFVPGHTDTKMPILDYPLRDKLLNIAADELATRAAKANTFPPSISTPVLFSINLVKAIQKRLIACVLGFPARAKLNKVEERCPRPALASLEVLCAVSSHTTFRTDWKIHCVGCLAAVSLRSPFLRDWIASPCPCIATKHTDFSHQPFKIVGAAVAIGKAVSHFSHHLWSFRGLVYCNKCGARSVSVLHGLANQCQPPTLAGSQVLNAISNDKLPPGLDHWPRRD